MHRSAGAASRRWWDATRRAEARATASSADIVGARRARDPTVGKGGNRAAFRGIFWLALGALRDSSRERYQQARVRRRVDGGTRRDALKRARQPAAPTSWVRDATDGPDCWGGGTERDFSTFRGIFWLALGAQKYRRESARALPAAGVPQSGAPPSRDHAALAHSPPSEPPALRVRAPRSPA